VGSPQAVLAGAAVLREVFEREAPHDSDGGAVAITGHPVRLILNDRLDLAVLAGFGGVHVGQGDLSPADARAVARGLPVDAFVGGMNWNPTQAIRPHERGIQVASSSERSEAGSNFWVGVSTHTEEQVRAADLSTADYVAVGPVFATGTKLDADPVIGLEGVRRARALTTKPIVAIGGITRENARSVVDAGADSVAVISGLLVPGETVAKVVGDFLRILG